MKIELKILLLEDNDVDASLICKVIKKANILSQIYTVDNKANFIRALKEFPPDIILSDHTLPSFNSLEAIKIIAEKGIKVPFILVTGTMSEEFAVTVMKEGAWDYIQKHQLHKLPDAINKAIDKFTFEKLRQKFLYESILNEAYMMEAEQIGHYGSWEFDMVNMKLKLSKEALNILDCEPGEIDTYLNVLNRVHRDDVNKVKRVMSSIQNNPDFTTYKDTIRIRNKIGLYKFIKAEFVLKHSIKNKLLRINGSIQDVTEFINIEEKLHESEARFKCLAENVQETAIILLGPDGQILNFNETAQNMLGYANSEVINKHISILYDHPKTLLKEISPYLDSISERDNSFKIDGYYVRKDGSMLWARFVITYLNTKSGSPRGFMIVMHEKGELNFKAKTSIV